MMMRREYTNKCLGSIAVKILKLIILFFFYIIHLFQSKQIFIENQRELLKKEFPLLKHLLRCLKRKTKTTFKKYGLKID